VLHDVDPDVEERQKQRLARIRRERDPRKISQCLADLTAVARTDDNLIPPTIEAVKVHATAGEIVSALRGVFGTYVEQPVF
jgi:methylmalonyl-CoA mutase N-terminal domain/subunit